MLLLVLPDHLFKNHIGLKKNLERVILLESPFYFDRDSKIKYHKQKLILHRASMRAYEDFLKKKGYNPDEVIITSGHRNPYHNKIDRGSPRSKHILGQALDFDVGDINRDGIANIEDKTIVYNILNKKLFKNHGGLGRYPHHEHALHIDTRIKKSRWDSY